MSPDVDSSSTTPCRTTAWSSATSTRIVTRSPRCLGYLHVDAGSCGIAGRVGHGLLHRPVDGMTRFGIEASGLSGDLQALGGLAFCRSIFLLRKIHYVIASHILQDREMIQ
jgi:hypothetical protein